MCIHQLYTMKLVLVVELVTELQCLEIAYQACQNLLGGANGLFNFPVCPGNSVICKSAQQFWLP